MTKPCSKDRKDWNIQLSLFGLPRCFKISHDNVTHVVPCMFSLDTTLLIKRDELLLQDLEDRMQDIFILAKQSIQENRSHASAYCNKNRNNSELGNGQSGFLVQPPAKKEWKKPHYFFHGRYKVLKKVSDAISKTSYIRLNAPNEYVIVNIGSLKPFHISANPETSDSNTKKHMIYMGSWVLNATVTQKSKRSPLEGQNNLGGDANVKDENFCVFGNSSTNQSNCPKPSFRNCLSADTLTDKYTSARLHPNPTS